MDEESKLYSNENCANEAYTRPRIAAATRIRGRTAHSVRPLEVQWNDNFFSPAISFLSELAGVTYKQIQSLLVESSSLSSSLLLCFFIDCKARSRNLVSSCSSSSLEDS